MAALNAGKVITTNKLELTKAMFYTASVVSGEYSSVLSDHDGQDLGSMLFKMTVPVHKHAPCLLYENLNNCNQLNAPQHFMFAVIQRSRSTHLC